MDDDKKRILKRITEQLREQNARVKVAEDAARQHFAAMYPNIPAPFVSKWLRRTGRSPAAIHYAHKLFELRNQQMCGDDKKKARDACFVEYGTTTLEQIDTDMQLLAEFHDAYARAKYLRDVKKHLQDELVL